MSEAALWDRTRDGMSPWWHAQRHEDKHSLGIPDVSYGFGGSDGWLELKYRPALPKSLRAPWDWSPKDFTPEQRNWLGQRSAKGNGQVFLLAYFEAERITALWRWQNYLLQQLGPERFGDVLLGANGLWQGAVDYNELGALLKGETKVVRTRAALAF